ncbi:MAG: MBL fold metallo-hydrolase [Candidatus Eisenbacteria bacterium]|nr:MBL fold metallo-hydrolase [Candidatus Eisenbacteria bacterium]
MKLKFLGAAGQVTGSCYLLEIDGTRMLIDCGLFQERQYLHRNWERFPFPPDTIDYVLLTHVHLDHSGLLPKLVKEGFRGRLLLTPASAEMLPIVLEDSARIQEEDAAYKKKRHRKEGRKGPHPEVPLYKVRDVERCLRLLKEVPYGTLVKLNGRLKVCFHDAGHILGSAMVEVVAHDGRRSRNIIFSGDIGQFNKPILNDPTMFDGADYVVMESTYGNRNHNGVGDEEEELGRVVGDTIKAGGNVLIPAFAIERAQQILYSLGGLLRERKIPAVTVFFDSPMGVEITKVFERSKRCFDKEAQALFSGGLSPFEFPGLRMVESVEDSKAIARFDRPSVIISGAGMLTGGRIKHHLQQNIGRPECTLVFVGYQAAGTLGRLIQEGVSPVRIHGQSHEVKMKTARIEGFSAHAGRDDLRRWMDGFASAPRRIFLTHGEENGISALAEYAASKPGWEVSAPRYREEFVI